MKYENSNYELAKQDREASDRNLVMEKTDLVNLLRPERPVRKMNNGDNSIVEGENENNGADGQQRDEKKKIDENMLKELCAISNATTRSSRRDGGSLIGSQYRRA